ncbi:insulinase family protein [Vibrio sp. S4M6]|uniref:M16 family metallopeptidase n=1 Tax=Vibrio sinus TaxID=2946865 RepID=UPI00202A5DA0|nr:pitrilysin family protein [Vibrio sinus]MCL9781007.1 insulinase family protein [Vibrio sinus]
MKKIWLGMLVLLVLAGCTSHRSSSLPFFSSLPKGVTLIEQVKAEPGKAMIPYSKYVLANGLTVILSPDHSDPLVHVDVTYHVGSAREQVGKSGFAHFFEHMMFQGSEHVGDQQHFKIITEAGGTLNGTTNRDRTNYFETVPANQLEKVLWLESDRMGFLLGAVSQRKFEIQRDTVKNERAQNYDNRPYGLAGEKMAEALFPEGHPYSWQTIGYVEDLDRVDVNDLKAFFLRWYGPNNAVLTIGGDIDVYQTLKWVNKYFGSIPKGPEVQIAQKQPAALPEDRFITLKDSIKQPMLLIGWPTEYRGAKSQASVDALAKVLGSGPNSVLYQKLVKTQKAVEAGAYQDCGELACTFYIYAMAPSGAKGNLTPLYNDIQAALQSFQSHGVDQSRLDQISGNAEANAIFRLQSVRGKVSQLAYNQTFYDQPDRTQTRLKEIKSVTPDSVMQAYKDFVDDHYKVVLSVVPKNDELKAVQHANFVTPKRTLPNYTKISDTQLNYRQVHDNFDRSVMPAVSGSVQAHMPELYQMHFANGAELLGTKATETPTVQIEIKLPAGARQVKDGQEGIADLTASVMQDGTKTHTMEQIQAKLDKLGSYIGFEAGTYSTTISISSLKKNLAETMQIVQEMLFEPAFNQQDFARSKKQLLEGVLYQHQKPSWLASQATRQVLFGDSVFARSSDGTAQSISGLTLDDVKAFYKAHYTPHGAQIIVVGDIDKKQAMKAMAFFSNWQGDAPPLIQPQAIPSLHGQKIYLVNKPNSPQTIVRFVRQGLPFDATGEVFLTQLANFNLAGNFNSRINQNLREDKGYTYGASGYLASNKEVGAIVFSAQVRANATIPSILEMEKEMRKFSQSGLTNEEVRFMRLAVGQQDALSYETPSKKASLLSNILTFSLDADYLQQRNEIVEAVSKSTLDKAAKKWFNPSDYQIIVVGDAKSLRPKLEKLSIPMEELEIIH